MRKYQPIWDTLKSATPKSISITAPLSAHARIMNAVSKEKCKDIVWQFSTLEKGMKYRLQTDIEGKILTFTLEIISI